MATEPSSGASVTPTPGSPVTGTTSPGVTPQKSAATLEEALARIAELEHNVRNKTDENDRHSKNLSAREKELAVYKEKERQAQDAALSEVDKANKAREQAEQQILQYKKQLVDARVELAAKAKGIINPSIAAAAIRDLLEYGDDGMPTNLEKALDDLIKANPYLIAKVEPASPAQTAPTPHIPAMNPGRSSIQSPGQTPGRIPSWNEVFKRP